MWSRPPHGVVVSLLVEACTERTGKPQRRLHEGVEPGGLLGSVPLWCDSAQPKVIHIYNRLG